MIATIPAQVVKRRGMSALDAQLKDGPVWVIANNTPKYVVLFADDFRRMRHEAQARRPRRHIQRRPAQGLAGLVLLAAGQGAMLPM